jgi:D-beta-D-heptose 7-phosphate kinase/D-beta-D-heptose 1-phosphate adenosyltransferase
MQDLKLPSLRDTHVVVVGDVMLDRYWYGDARRVSQEAPVPVVDIAREEHRPGGAANVALNVASIGARCTLLGVVGDDSAARLLRGSLEAAGVRCEFVTAADFATIVKLRIVSQRQQLLRADFDRAVPDIQADLQGRLEALLRDADVLVLEDYDKNTLAKPAAMIALARAAGVPVIVDPKAKPLSAYAGATLIKPNDHEFRAAAAEWTTEDRLVELARSACQTHHVDALVITRGNRGMTVVAGAGQAEHIPAHEVEVFDVTGAGDTVAALLAIGTAVGWDVVRSARLANLGASLVVAKVGTATVSGPELANAVMRRGGRDRGVLSREQLAAAVALAKAAGERIVFTNGCFDILHAGHVTYLEEARALGDRLIVAVNDDASVQRLEKGPNRPVNTLDRRMRVLAGLTSVDWVVSFHEDTPEPLLERLRPHVLVKGGDYQPEQVVGHTIVQGYGGEVRVLSLVADTSTTAIIEKIQAGG